MVRWQNQYNRNRFYSDSDKECSDCEEIKPHEEFYSWKNGVGPKNLSWYCKECCKRKGRENHSTYKTRATFRDAKRNTYIKSKYGITLDDYKERLIAQNNKCAICRVELSIGGQKAHFDHCHATGKPRMFLCTNCNQGLGHFKDNIANLKTAIDYLNAHSDSVDVVKEE